MWTMRLRDASLSNPHPISLNNLSHLNFLLINTESYYRVTIFKRVLRSSQTPHAWRTKVANLILWTVTRSWKLTLSLSFATFNLQPPLQFIHWLISNNRKKSSDSATAALQLKINDFPIMCIGKLYWVKWACRFRYIFFCAEVIVRK